MMVTSMTQPATNAAQSTESKPSTSHAHALLTHNVPMRMVLNGAASNGSHQHSHQMLVQDTAALSPTTPCLELPTLKFHKLLRRVCSTTPQPVSHTTNQSQPPTNGSRASALVVATEPPGRSAATDTFVSTSTNDAATQPVATDSPAPALRVNAQEPSVAERTQSTMTLGSRFALRRRT